MFPVYKDKNTREGEEKGEAAEMVLRDQEILSLCQARDQRAIAALAEKYGAYCHTVAHNILGDHPDAEECVNDAYLAVWNGVPNAPPRSLLAWSKAVSPADHFSTANPAGPRSISACATCSSRAWQPDSPAASGL